MFQGSNSELEKEKFAVALALAGETYNYTAISFDLRYYRFFSNHLRTYTRENGWAVFGWDLGVRMDQKSSVEELTLRYSQDADVDVILVKFPSVFDL